MSKEHKFEQGDVFLWLPSNTQYEVVGLGPGNLIDIRALSDGLIQKNRNGLDIQRCRGGVGWVKKATVKDRISFALLRNEPIDLSGVIC